MADNDLLVEIARFVERVAATARTGLAFNPGGYDSERYEEMLHAAARLSAAVAGADPRGADALRRRWREAVIAGYDGYVTPGAGCGAIAFNDRDEVLMLRRTSGRWWYPGGFCDVGLSPAENAAKEAREETGIIVRPIRLMAIVDSLKAGSAHRHVYTALFYCKVTGGKLRPSPLEALEAGFFALDALPQPLHRDDLRWAELARQFHFGGRVEPFFDPVSERRD